MHTRRSGQRRYAKVSHIERALTPHLVHNVSSASPDQAPHRPTPSAVRSFAPSSVNSNVNDHPTRSPEHIPRRVSCELHPPSRHSQIRVTSRQPPPHTRHEKKKSQHASISHHPLCTLLDANHSPRRPSSQLLTFAQRSPHEARPTENRSTATHPLGLMVPVRLQRSAQIATWKPMSSIGSHSYMSFAASV